MTVALRRSVRLLFAGILVCTLAQSCSSGKKCGCGGDINRAYQPRQFR